MEKDFPSDYQKGLEALQDIIQVAGTDVGPIATNALYHFSRAQQASLRNAAGALPGIKSFLEGGVRELALRYFLDKFQGAQLSLDIRPGMDDLAEWDKLIECLPSLLELTSLFTPTAGLELVIAPGSACIRMGVALDASAQSARQRAYQIYRRLFAKRVLACYSVGPGRVEGECTLTITADLGEDRASAYAVNLPDGTILAMPSSFIRYKISKEAQVDGACLEITDRLGLITHRRFPSGEWALEDSREALHFPFLFRPISLIIPNKGKLIPLPATDGEGSTGSDADSVSQKGTAPNGRLQFLDFFSYFAT